MEPKGLNRDINLAQLPDGAWIYARNIVFGKGYKSIENERGFSEDISIDNTIIGIIECSAEYVVFSTDNTYLEIGVVRVGTYTKVLKTQYIPSDDDRPITGVYRYNYDGELIVVWTDDYDFPRILNLDNLPFKLDINKEIKIEDNVIYSKLYPDYKIPTFSLVSVDEGGRLLSGIRYYTLQYEIEDGI